MAPYYFHIVSLSVFLYKAACIFFYKAAHIYSNAIGYATSIFIGQLHLRVAVNFRFSLHGKRSVITELFGGYAM